MKLRLIPALAVMLLLPGCDDEDVPYSGTITLDNVLYESGSYYYALGLSFEEGIAVPTLPDAKRYDIIVPPGNEPLLSANTLEEAFALMGEYSSETDAKNAFKALTAVGSASYIAMASPLKNNQVWVVRTRDRNDNKFRYAKIRTIEVTLDTTADPDYASCKLEWVYQPDGSATFP
jgi:hypothetical protein